MRSPTPATTASEFAIRGRGALAARRGARVGRRLDSKVVFSAFRWVVTSVMLGRYGVTIRGTPQVAYEFVENSTLSDVRLDDVRIVTSLIPWCP